MKNLKKLLLLSTALMATVTLPINLGGRFASRMGKLGAEFAGKAKTATLNIKANPFPVFCKAVSSGVLPYAVMGAGLAMQTHGFKGEKKPVDAKVAEFVRGSLNIPVLFEPDQEKEDYIEGFVQGMRDKGALGLTSYDPFIHFHLNAAAGPQGIIFNAAMYKLLCSPQLFCNTQEYNTFRTYVKAILQHEGGHSVENHSLQQLAWILGSPVLLHKTGKRLGPLAKRLVGMNPVATTKMGMFGRALGGGVLKGVGTLTGALALQKHHEYRADSYIDDEHKKYTAYRRYLQGSGLWHDTNPHGCCRANLNAHSPLSTHPHDASRIKHMCGTVEKGAEHIVAMMRENTKLFFERRKEQMSALKTEAEKIEFLVKHCDYSQDMSMWEKAPEEYFKEEYDFADEKIQHCLNDNAQQWIDLKATVIKNMEDALSLTHNIKGAVLEKGNEYMKKYARYIMEQEVKDVERLQKQLAELTTQEDQVKFCADKFDFFVERVQIQNRGVELRTAREKIALTADPESAIALVSSMVGNREAVFKQNNPEAESQSFQAKMFPKYYEALDELWREREAAQAKAAAQAAQEKAAAEALKNAKQEAEQAAEPANADEQKQ